MDQFKLQFHRKPEIFLYYILSQVANQTFRQFIIRKMEYGSTFECLFNALYRKIFIFRI